MIIVPRLNVSQLFVLPRLIFQACPINALSHLRGLAKLTRLLTDMDVPKCCYRVKKSVTTLNLGPAGTKSVLTCMFVRNAIYFSHGESRCESQKSAPPAPQMNKDGEKNKPKPSD